MKPLNQLDSAALNAVREAIDAYQRFEHSHPDSAVYFRRIITRLLGRLDEFDIWEVRAQINQEEEKRSRRSVYATVRIVSNDHYEAISQLSHRERTILRLIGEGQRPEMIQDVLSIAYRTLANHRTNIAAKLGLASVRDLPHFAIQNMSMLD